LIRKRLQLKQTASRRWHHQPQLLHKHLLVLTLQVGAMTPAAAAAAAGAAAAMLV
jgi:hypothetical protein